VLGRLRPTDPTLLARPTWGWRDVHDTHGHLSRRAPSGAVRSVSLMTGLVVGLYVEQHGDMARPAGQGGG
jgi:hypothetical protein